MGTAARIIANCFRIDIYGLCERVEDTCGLWGSPAGMASVHVQNQGVPDVEDLVRQAAAAAGVGGLEK